MASAETTVTLTLDEEAAAILLNLMAALDRLTAALGQKQAARETKPVYLEGNGE